MYQHDLSDCITIGKIYEAIPDTEPIYSFVIIDDVGHAHIIPKECFKPLREINLDKLI